MTEIKKGLLWWQTGVFYQIYPRSFKDSNGDGIGDLAGIILELDYLTNILDVDAIWLSPFYPSPMADFGYDVADYTSVDPIFGSIADFDRLIEEAHRRGLKVVIDLVPNHTSYRHPWFQESISARDNPKRDWYIWADPRQDGSPPNNWLSIFGGSAWEWEPMTEQFYLHSFLKEQPDLNWRNPQVKEAIFEVVHFWLIRGVDGFRIDVAHFIMKDPLLRDNPLVTIPLKELHKSLGEYDLQIHKYDKDHADTHVIYRELRQLLNSYSDDQPRVSIGEIHIFNWNNWASYYGQNLDELHMPFNFQLLNIPWDASLVRNVVEAQEASLPPDAWPNYVLGNHDEPRLASRLDPEAARVAAMLLLTLRGTPTLYYGDEIGLTDGYVPNEQQQDPLGFRVAGMGRDPCRTPMQWNSEIHAGFSPPTAPRLWLPVGENYRQVNVQSQIREPHSILSLYRQLIAYRKGSKPLRWGEYIPVDNVPSDCFAYIRKTIDDELVLIVLNFSLEHKDIKLTDFNKGELKISTFLDRSGEINLSGWILRGNEGVIIELC